MRIKRNFRNETSQDFSETLAFRMKSSWKTEKRHPSNNLKTTYYYGFEMKQNLNLNPVMSRLSGFPRPPV